MICVNAKCKRRTHQEDKVFFGYPEWLALPDTVVEHCACGKHNRVWSAARAAKFFQTNGVKLSKMVRVAEIHRG